MNSSRKWLDYVTNYRIIVLLCLFLVPIHVQGAAECKANSSTVLTIDATNATMINPSRGNGSYLPSMTCTWNITSPVNTLAYVILLYHELTENKTICQQSETLNIFDGVSTSSNNLYSSCSIIEKLNYTGRAKRVTATDRYALVQYKTPSTGNATAGYKLERFMVSRVELTGTVECKSNQNTVLAKSVNAYPNYTFIYPPRMKYNDNYMFPNVTCTWNITAPMGSIVSLFFTLSGLTLNQTVCERSESLKAFDGPTTSSNLVLNNCNPPKDDGRYKFYTSSQHALVEYKTPATTNGQLGVMFRSLKFTSFKKSTCENGKVTNLTASANTTNNITSPYYNDGYPKDSNCAWRITAPPGQFIKLQVKSDLSCYLNDQLNIYDSDTNNAEQHIAKICDEGKLRTIVSTGETMYILFVINSTKVIYYNYFIIHYSSYLPATTCSPSNSAEENLNIIIQGSNKGIVESPNFPKPFPSNLFCKWKFVAPKGYSVKIFVETLNLNVKSGCLIYPYLRLFDGFHDRDSQFLGKGECRSAYQRLAPSFYALSSGNNLKMDFQSDKSIVTGYGFRANYTFQPLDLSGSCGEERTGTINLRGQGASFYSPGYTWLNTKQHPKDMTCIWNITADPGYIIELTTKDNSLKLTCSDEYVNVYDGSLDSQMLGTMCNKKYIGIVYSTGNSMLVKMKTSPSDSRGTGIFMTYRAVQYQRPTYVCKPDNIYSKISNTKTAKVVSPWYPIGYPNNVRCFWQFTAPFTYNAKVTINKLHLQESLNCEADKIKITGGDFFTSSIPNGTLCGQLKSPVTITTSYGKLMIELRSDWRGQYPGFEAVFDSVIDNSFGDCRVQGKDNYLPLNTSSGVIFSPRYPKDIPPNMMCTWLITAPQGRYVRLQFVHFDLDYSCTGKSQLEVRDGASSTSKLINKYCSTKVDKSIMSSGRYLWLRFTSTKRGYVDKGFNATYSSVTTMPFSMSCKNSALQKIVDSSGEIASHDYPLNYGNNMECQWRITVPDGKRVKLTFETFHLQKTKDCAGDYVQVFDGMSKYSESLGKYCGDSTPEPIHSDGTWMYINFKTDSTGQFPGFKAKFEAVLSVQSIVLIVVFTLMGVGVLCSCIGWCLKSQVYSHNPVSGPADGAASTAGSNIELTSKM